MKAFVTGSTGLLGSNLVRLLVEQGHEVKALARSKDKAVRLLSGLKVEIVTGDMEDVAAFAPALAGCDVLFHTAAYFRDYFQPGEHWETLQKINVKGTLELLGQAEKYGVRKAIYVSSSGIVVNKPDGQPGDESNIVKPEALKNLYFRSKALAEIELDKFLATHFLPVVIILPTVMLGPGDAGPTAMGQLVQDFLNRKLPGVVEGGLPFVDARDVAQAMLKAVEQGQSGERYLLSQGFHTMDEMTKVLSKVSGLPAPKLHLPYLVTLFYAAITEIYARFTKKPILISVEGIRALHAGHDANPAKAQLELGATFRPFEETLRDEVNWYRQTA